MPVSTRAAPRQTSSAFALKALLILHDDSIAGSDIGNRMAVLEGKRVRYRGATVNRTMMTATLAFQDKINAQSLKVINNISARHGRDILATGYTKLMRIGQVCNNQASSVHASCAELFQYFLEALEWSLNFEVAQP